MPIRPRALILGALALPFAFATASLAQDHPAGPPGDHPGMGRMNDPAFQARMAEMRAKREAAHAQRLRDILQLRSDQEPALQAFLSAMKPPAGEREHMRHEHEGPGPEAMTTPQRLDRMLARMDERRTHMVAHAEAVKRFYAQLNATQQKAFDAMEPMVGGRHGGHGMGEHGMGGRHGGMHGPDGDGPPPEGGPPPR